MKLMRTGRSWGRTLVEHGPDDSKGQLVGMVDTPALAREIADAVNAARTGALPPTAPACGVLTPPAGARTGPAWQPPCVLAAGHDGDHKSGPAYDQDTGQLAPDAAVCRVNGWGPGTRLVGDEGDGPTVIEITAVGRELVLAVAISHNGRPVAAREAVWTLQWRAWQVHDR